jgi:hypothetical protein
VTVPVSVTKHWQGVQRTMTGGGKYLVVSRSGANQTFAVVRMGSRDSGGHRFRSNRIGANGSSVVPPSTDKVVKEERAISGFDHSGGVQMVGKYLVVGSEAGSASAVAFYDMENPENPVRVGSFARTTQTKGAGTISIGKLRSGQYLLIVGGAGAIKLDFYVSRPGSTLANPLFDFVTTWSKSELRVGGMMVGGGVMDPEFSEYQSLNLLSNTDGNLFLIGTHQSGDTMTGEDEADFFLLSNNGAGGAPVVTKLASQHLYCGAPGLALAQCNLDAGGGVYISPEGRLLLYATEHYATGPGMTVKMEEFRTAPHRSSCESIQEAWVELYDDDHFDGDRSIMIDYRDRNKRNYNNYDQVEGFEDKTSAARWCLPSGWKYRLYEDKSTCSGSTRDLVGTGKPKEDKNFGNDEGIANFGDKVSCSKWIGP